MEISYNTPIEVSFKHYVSLMYRFAGRIAGRETEDRRFFIKLWDMKIETRFQLSIALREAL